MTILHGRRLALSGDAEARTSGRHIGRCRIKPINLYQPCCDQAWLNTDDWSNQPRPAVRTQPMMTWSTESPGRSIRFKAAPIAMPPSLVAGIDLNTPLKLPIGVRTALTMTALGLGFIVLSP